MNIIKKPSCKIIISLGLISQLLFGTTASIFADDAITEIVTSQVGTSTNDVIDVTIVDTPPVNTTASSTEISVPDTEIDFDSIASTTTSTTTDTIEVSSPQDSLDQVSTTTIVTGDAVATANILNLLNTNLVNSSGTVLFSNIYEGHVGNIDFRNPISASTTCTLLSCEEDTILVKISNDAVLKNDIILEAITGNNLIVDADNALIETGNAYTGLNLVNIVNTNFIDSEYVLISFNAFKGVNGDIIFPSLSKFFDTYSSGYVSDINTSNTGVINNGINVNTQTGDNEIGDAKNSSIVTGTSSSVSTTYNNLNTTLVGGNNVSILFKINGVWHGQIFGLPSGFMVIKGDDGSIYLSSQGLGENLSLGESTDVSVNATNTATIDNTIDINALTGKNKITGADTALISAGNAYAGINVVNIANGNVVGHNWMLAVLNIFGDFTGNISFGQPNLWIGGKVDVPTKIENNSIVTYIHTIKNNGDSIASDIILTDKIDINHVEIINSSLPYELKGDSIIWTLDSLSEGDTREINYTAKIKNASPGTLIKNTINVTEKETDSDLDDNTDTITFITSGYSSDWIGSSVSGGSSSSGGNNGVGGTSGTNQSSLSGITIERKDSSIVLNSNNRTANQELIIKNSQNVTISNIVLHDVLRNISGDEINTEIWKIGDIKPFEEIIIRYDITFDLNALPGIYNLSTVLTRDSKLEKVFPGNGTIELIKDEIVPSGVAIGKVFTMDEPTKTDTLIKSLILPSTVESSNNHDNDVNNLTPEYGYFGKVYPFRLVVYLFSLLMLLFLLFKKFYGIKIYK